MGLLKDLKNQKKAENKEFLAGLKELNKEFIRFQIQHKARAYIANEFQTNTEYPPNAIVDTICSLNRLAFRPMETDEIESLNKKLVEDAGIVLPK